MPPMITTTSEYSSQLASTPGARLANEPPITPPSPAKRRADSECDCERQLDVDPERRDHRAVVDAGADHHSRARLLQPKPERDPDRERDAEDDQARFGVLDPLDVDVHELVQVARPRDVLGDAAEMREHLVGEDDRDRDRDQRLTEVLALVPAQEQLLHHHSHRGDDERRDDRRHDPMRQVDLRACSPNPPPSPTMLRCSFSAM